MVELRTGPRHPLSCSDIESYFDLHVVPPGYQPIGEVDCGYLAQYIQAYSRWVGLVSLGRLPTWDRETLIL